MSIDGIGKPPPVAPPSGAGGPAQTDAEFRVGETRASTQASGVEPSSALARLERGEIGLDAYLDARVAAATEHLSGRLGPEQLAFVKQSLRAELESDPVLVELVRRTTGRAAASPT